MANTPFTNYTHEFKGMIDYIFYTKDLLTLTGLLDGISHEWFHSRKIPGCPFLMVPSDHMPLLVEYAFKRSNSVMNSINWDTTENF